MSWKVSKYFQKKKDKSPTDYPKVDKTQFSRPANVDLQSRVSAEPSASGQVSCELLHGYAYGCHGMPFNGAGIRDALGLACHTEYLVAHCCSKVVQYCHAVRTSP